MDSDRLKDALLNFGKGLQTETVWVGEVVAVDKPACTCDVKDTKGIEIFDIRLRATLDQEETGLMIFPKVGSFVMVGQIGNSDEDFCVVQYSAVEQVLVRVGQVTLDVDESGVKISKGNDSLISVLKDLNQAIKAITVTCASPGSPSTPPLNAATFTVLSNRISNILK